MAEEKEAEKEGIMDGGIKPAVAKENADGGSSSIAEDENHGVFSTCGTTSLIVVVSDLHVICCNTGDSRCAHFFTLCSISSLFLVPACDRLIDRRRPIFGIQ